MATNKNQHFVPRCYLKPFTVDGQGLAINLFNLDLERVIPNAPVKNQCSGDYFYGNNQKLESAIQGLEGSYASTLKKITEPGYKLTKEDRTTLKIFWLFQHLRTEAASKKFVEMAARIGTDIDQKETFKYEIKEAVQSALLTFKQHMDEIADLKACLVKNNSQAPFITSDDPAIFTNLWSLLNSGRSKPSFGLHSAGAIALLPLTPSILFLAYDADVYSIESKNGWVKTRSAHDVYALNQHQYLACMANIYIKSPGDAQELASKIKEIKSLRPAERYSLNYATPDQVHGSFTRYKTIDTEAAHKLVNAPQGNTELLIHFSQNHPKPTIWPSFLRWRPKGFVYTNGTGVGYVREYFAHALKNPPPRKEPAFTRR